MKLQLPEFKVTQANILLTLYFFDNLSVAILIPFLSLYYKNNLNLPADSREYIASLYNVFQITGSLLFSRLADKTIALRRQFLLLSFGGSFFSYTLFYIALKTEDPTKSLCLVVVSRCFVGLVKQTGVITTTILTEQTTNKAATLAWLNGIMTVAWIGGPSLGSLLYNRVDETAPAVVSAAIFLAVFVAGCVVVDATKVLPKVPDVVFPGVPPDAQGSSSSGQAYATMTVATLRRACDERGIEHKALRLKADIVKALEGEEGETIVPQGEEPQSEEAAVLSLSSFFSFLPSLSPLILSFGNRFCAPIAATATTTRYSLPPSVLGYLSSYMSILHLSSLTFLLPLLPKDIPLLPVFSSILLATIYFFDTTLYPDHPSPVLYLLLLQPLYTSLYLLGKINASSSSLKATKSPATLLTVLDFGQNVIGIVVPIARVTILKALDAVDDEDKQMRLWSYVASATWLSITLILLLFHYASSRQPEGLPKAKTE